MPSPVLIATLPVKAICYNDIGLVTGDVAALDETHKVKIGLFGEVCRSRYAPLSAQRVLCVLRFRHSAGRSGGALRAMPLRAYDAPINAHIATRSLASARTSAPTSSITLKPCALRDGHRIAIAGRLTPGSLRRRIIDKRHQRAGISAGHGAVGLAVFARLSKRRPHRGLLAVPAQPDWACPPS